jgi:protein SCO1/2
MTTQRILILLLAVMGGLALAGALVLLKKNTPAKDGLAAVTDDRFGGAFSLTDQNGNTVTDKSFDGKYRLIFFGFTYCPAICPTELAKIAAALNGLGEKGKEIQPIFITVDPERDTPEKLKNYVSLYHPSLVGLTGTTEQVKDVLKSYKVYAAKVEDPSMSEYTMDHSAFIYFIAPDGRLLHIFKMQDKADDMTDIMSRWMKAS